MSVDTLALLRIKKLVLPRDPTTGIEIYVAHQGNASIVSTWTRWNERTPDELSMLLRKHLGPALDAHDDPRGILFFPDVCEFRGKSYDAIAGELAKAGVWAPKVDADYVPARYTQALAGTHDARIMEMIGRMGRDAALEYDAVAQVHCMMEIMGTADTPDMAEGIAEHARTLESQMGPEFSARYQESVRKKAKGDFSEMQASRDANAELVARVRSGEAIVTAEEFDAFLTSDAGAAVFEGFDPKFRAALEAELASLNVEGLPDGDLAKQIAAALKRPKS